MGMLLAILSAAEYFGRGWQSQIPAAQRIVHSDSAVSRHVCFYSRIMFDKELCVFVCVCIWIWICLHVWGPASRLDRLVWALIIKINEDVRIL